MAKKKKIKEFGKILLGQEPDYDPQEAGNETLGEDAPPSVKGEQSISGDMPDPESDDDVLKAAHQVGVGLDDKPGKPKPLDLAGDVEKAEKKKREK